uniref:Protein FAM73A n=1 Tax=Aceria tosichella TaxID=561515 RepID=A0A6G1SFT0_9ACAR
MLQIQKQHIIGLVVCGAALIGARWLYLYHIRDNSEGDLPELDQSRRDKRHKTRASRRPSQSIISNSQLSLLGLDSAASVTSISSWTNQTSGLVFFDVEPNLHFFKIYQDQLAIVDSIPMPRTDRTEQLLCESLEEFLAKVSCLRNAFQDIIYDNENCFFFIESGREILKFFLAHSRYDLENCLQAYDNLLDYVADESNHEAIQAEIGSRRIPILSFYDLVIDYIILESLDDLNDPPKMVAGIISNTWVSSSFRQSACQKAVSTALKYKRSQLKYQDGFFAHFYSVLDYLSPTLAWGFLGSDEDLQTRCEFLKETLLSLCRDYFSFDRVRYTSYEDLKIDIMNVTRERYENLTERLSISYS